MQAPAPTHNCHFITRFLTDPWEQGQRRLWFYDFDTDSFDEKSSKSLFAEDQINSPAVEAWLNRVIETPFGRAKPRLAAADPQALSSWPVARAAAMMLWLQGLRCKSVGDEVARKGLDEIAASTDEELDRLVMLIVQDFDLQLVYTVGVGQSFAPLFFPSTGVFPLVYRDRSCLSGHSVGLALPLDLHCALVAVPADTHGKADHSTLPPSLANFSVGTGNATRVVIAPAARAAYPEAHHRKALQECRRINGALAEGVEEKRRLTERSYRAAFLAVTRDNAGRVVRVRY